MQESFRKERGWFGSMLELQYHSVSRSLASDILIPDGTAIAMGLARDSWYASNRSVAGWMFAIGGTSEATFYFDSADPPTLMPPDSDWRTTDDGNWSGDCFW